MLQESEFTFAIFKCYFMTNDSIIVFQEESAHWIDANSLELKKSFRYAESLSIDFCQINRNSFALCHNPDDKNIFLCSVRLWPEDLDKISYKTLYDEPSFGHSAFKGQFCWNMKFQFSSSQDSLVAYKTKTESILLKDW